jgi:hypothetical protein
VRLDTPLGSVCCAALGFGAIRVEASASGPATATVRTAAPHAPLDVPEGVRLIHEQ